MTTARELMEPDEEQLLQELRDFKEMHGRIPMTSDFSRGMLRSRQIYNRHFGGLNEARLAAGLDAVVPLPFGQAVQLNEKQYRAYKAGHAIPGINHQNAVKQREKRRRKKAARRAAGIGEQL